MLDSAIQSRRGNCPRCGEGPEKALSDRIARMDRGYVDIIQCEACGYLRQADVPHVQRHASPS